LRNATIDEEPVHEREVYNLFDDANSYPSDAPSDVSSEVDHVLNESDAEDPILAIPEEVAVANGEANDDDPEVFDSDRAESVGSEAELDEAQLNFGQFR